MKNICLKMACQTIVYKYRFGLPFCNSNTLYEQFFVHSEFINLLSSESNEVCSREEKKTIAPEHVLKALSVSLLSFHKFIILISRFLIKLTQGQVWGYCQMRMFKIVGYWGLEESNSFGQRWCDCWELHFFHLMF
jgi:hypothetical protein